MIVLTTLVALSVNTCWGMITAYINERFHTGVRASGFGLGYSLAVVLPSFYAGYQSLLGNVMNPAYTPLPLLAIGGVLITIGGAIGPETRDVDIGGRPPVRRPRRARAALRARAVRDTGGSPTGVATSREERVR